MSKAAIYPGSFDPVTYGHIDVIKRAARIFDTVIVAVANNTQKKTLFSIDERVAMLSESIKELENVVVEDFSGLIIDYARSKDILLLIRGMRMISDFEFELQMALPLV